MMMMMMMMMTMMMMIDDDAVSSDIHFSTQSELNIVVVDGPTTALDHLTICMWLRFGDDGRYVGLVSCLRGNDYEMVIAYNNNGQILYLGIDNKSRTRGLPSALGTNTWKLLCFARTTSYNDYYVFVDGKLAVTGGPLSQNGKVGGPGTKFYLGQLWSKTTGTFSQPNSYAGYMNDVNVWNEVFSEVRIRQLWLTCGWADGNAVAWSALRTAAPSNLVSRSKLKCPVRRESSCLEYLTRGFKGEDFFYIDANKIDDLPVYCTTINGGGWMVALRRSDSVVSFDRVSQGYKDGFGSCMDNVNAGDTWLNDGCTSDLWLGNKYFTRLTTAKGSHQLLVRLKDQNNIEVHAVYKRFAINALKQYALYIQGYAGTAGDALQVHHGMNFTARNEDNDLDPNQNCADNGRGGWWYNACGDSQLNGVFGSNGANGILWNKWLGAGQPLLEATMMIKPNKERDWDYSLYFETAGLSRYVGPLTVTDFLEVTVCWWMIPHGTPMAVFSLANSQANDALTFLQNSGLSQKLIVNGQPSSLVNGKDLSDLLWHHVCTTWRSTDGRWSVHVDGSRRGEDFNLAKGAHIKPGTLYIGQFQNSLHNFQPGRSFSGYLSHFNMWNIEMSDEKIQRMSLGCGAEVGNLIPWPEVKWWVNRVAVEEPSSCTAREKHRLDFSSLSSDNSFSELLSTRKVFVEDNVGVDASMKVLSIQGNAKIKFTTTRDDCLNEPSVCPGGFTVSFWLKHEPKFISHILGGSSTRHQTLSNWLSQVTPNESRWTRCYRAVDDGWSATTFHTNCDNRGPTVTLVKTGDYIFGGFLDQSWGGERNLTSSSAFLFSLQNPEYPEPIKLDINTSYINTSGQAARSDLFRGPVFGDGDLFINDSANEGIYSYSNPGHVYQLPDGIEPYTAAADNLLAGSAYFIPDDIEVFAYEVPHFPVNISGLVDDGDSGATWGSSLDGKESWLQVDLGQIGPVGFVSTMFRLNASLSYYLAYSVDNSSWNDYKEGGFRKKADANRSKLEGLDQILQAGVEAEFTLCPKTSEGELSNQADLKDRVEVLIEPQKDITDVMVSDKEDGNLQLKFTPKALGAYSIEVKINGDKLPTCPFTMQVKERELVVVGEVDLKSLEGNQPQGLHGIAVNTDGKMVVIDSNRHCVHVLDEKGNRLSKFGNKGSNSGQFKSPAGVAFLNDNEILVADQRKHRIQHINIQTGTVVKSFGKCGAGKDEVKHPVDVCLDDEGRIVVTDCDNHRIHVLSKEGETISIFGDRSPEKFNYPRSCIPYENMFFVSDGINICIKVNDQTGKFLYKFGKKGNQYGEFNWPCGMLVDRSNNLLVCDKYNVRVQQFSLDGRFTGKTVTHLPSPSGIATAPDGRILLTSSAANKVYILK
ncbi:hypothetical protein ACROYT_G035785 [Oculina patagonica]